MLADRGSWGNNGTSTTAYHIHEGTACSVAVKLLDLDPRCRWFDPWCGHDKICTAVGPLSKALNPTLLLISLINCKSLWIRERINDM